MKRNIYSKLLIALIAFAAVACKQNKLDDVSLIKNDGKSVSGENIDTANIVLGSETVTVPFKVSLSAPASKAFQIGIALNNDTVAGLITNGTLTNTVVTPNGAVDYPNVVNVAYGAVEASGIVTVRLSALERNYGKIVAFALKLQRPGKDNVIKNGQSNILVQIDTKALIKEDELHYLSILNGGTEVYHVDYQKGYYTSPAGITIPLTLNLAGTPVGAFNVKVKLNKDTVAKLITDKVIPDNSIVLDDNQFSLDTNIRVNSNISTATIRLGIEWPVFDANIIPNKRFAFVVELADPTKHVLNPAKSRIIIVVEPTVVKDNNSFITGDGTGLKAEYFSNNQLLDFDGRKPDLVRIEPNIDWTGDGPWQDATPTISRDNFSTRWTGEFLAPVNGQYRFWQNEWDDGARLFVNGVTIVDDFTQEWDKESRNGYITLERGKRYKIEAHHRENVGGQRARLMYEVPSAGINGRRVIPQSQLYPAQ